MKTQLLRLPEVIKRTGLSRSTIYKSINENSFPKPIKIGVRSVAWIDSEIGEWQDSIINRNKELS
ncbi:MAG: AlpA family transcriptional regulator [Gammaproteobacteria bacterium]|nr:AlpA family transcriptional regulator [Gammaproteobacteria bacterium]